MTASRRRIALLTEIPSPYRIPLFNALAERTDLRVLFLGEVDPTHPYPVYSDEFRFESKVLPGVRLVRGKRWIVFSRRVIGELRRFSPQVVVICGWSQPAFWVAAGYARTARRPILGWVESTSRDARPGNRALELAKRSLIRSFDGCIVPGSESRSYVGTLGMALEKVAIAPNAIDPDIFGGRVAETRLERDRLRKELGMSRVTVLYVGRLEPEKGLDVLLEAAENVPADVVIVGAGSEDARLRAAAPPNVRFVGRLERDGLVPWYAAADVFVLPSLSEQWALVLNEAATAGLPLVASDAAGGAWDLIDDGVNGFRVPAGDPEALAVALARLAEDPALRESAGRRSLEIAERFTPQAWAEAVVLAVEKLV